MQRYPAAGGSPAPAGAPLVLVFERNDAVAVPLLAQLRMAGYDVRAARIPVEVFDLMQKEPVELVLIDLGNAAANRREFWVGLDSQRRARTVHVITFRYMATGETGELESGLRVARADIEIQSAQGFGPLLEALRARLPGAIPSPQFNGPPPNLNMSFPGSTPANPQQAPRNTPLPGWSSINGPVNPSNNLHGRGDPDASPFAQPYASNPFKQAKRSATPSVPTTNDPFYGGNGPLPQPAGPFTPQWSPPMGTPPSIPLPRDSAIAGAFSEAFGTPATSDPGINVSPMRDNGFGTSNGHGPVNGSVSRPAINDAWTPPEPTQAPRRGIAYRGYDEEPLAPDDPRIEDSTSPVPIVSYNDLPHGHRNERALSTILSDGAVMAPQRMDALRSIQETLAHVGMDFTLGDLAMLFKFLTPDQLLAALLVSRNIVSAEQVATLGRVKQEMQISGKDYSLEELLVMFNVLPADQIRALRAELG